MSCNGTCLKLKTMNMPGVITRYGQGRYDQGQRWCSTCGLFIQAISKDLTLCPCCRSKLRTRPRMMKFKNKFRNRMSNGFS